MACIAQKINTKELRMKSLMEGDRMEYNVQIGIKLNITEEGERV